MTIIVTALARLEYQCPDLCDRIAGRVQRNPGQWELTQLVSIVDSFAKLKYDNPVRNSGMLWLHLRALECSEGHTETHDILFPEHSRAWDVWIS